MKYRIEQTFCLALIGLPGAGKTTLAKNLAVEISGLRIVSRDLIREAMFDPCTFSQEEKQAAFRSLRLAQEAIWQRPESTVIDGTCFSEIGPLDCVAADTKKSGVRLVKMNCQCPVDVAKQRVEIDRQLDAHPAKDRDAGLVAKVNERFFDVPASYPAIDMTQPVEQVTQDGIAVLLDEGVIDL